MKKSILTISFVIAFVMNINATQDNYSKIIPLEKIDGVTDLFSNDELAALKDMIFTFDSLLIKSPDQTYNQAYLGLLISLVYQALIFNGYDLDSLTPNIDKVFNCVDSFDSNLFDKLFIKNKHIEPDSLGVRREYLLTQNLGVYGDFISILCNTDSELRWYLDYIQTTGDCDGNPDCFYRMKDFNFNNEGVRLVFIVHYIAWYDIDN